MFKALIDRLLGRTESARAESLKDHGATTSLMVPTEAVIQTSCEVSASHPPTEAPEPKQRPDVLFAYSPVKLDDNPLAVRVVRKTGTITWVPQLEGWCINPSTTFPLTVVGTNEETARQVREAMDGLVDYNFEDVAEVVAGLMVEHGARFHEFEDYLTEQRRVYNSTLAAKRAARTSKKSSHEENDDIENEALDALDKCSNEFEMLIEGDYPSDPAEITAIRRFGYGNLMSYFGTGADTVKIVSPDHRERPGFDVLVRAGLAMTGAAISDIPTRALLHAMTIKELQSLSLRPIPTKSRKKDLAVEYLLGQDNVRERAIAGIPLEAVYYLVPLPGALTGHDPGGMQERMGFAWRVADLVVATYFAAALAPTNREYEGKHLAAKRFRVSNTRDVLTCRSCRKSHGQSKPLADWNQFPLHFGCRCSLQIIGG
jgi:hypothetical protein